MCFSGCYWPARLGNALGQRRRSKYLAVSDACWRDPADAPFFARALAFWPAFSESRAVPRLFARAWLVLSCSVVLRPSPN